MPVCSAIYGCGWSWPSLSRCCWRRARATASGTEYDLFNALAASITASIARRQPLRLSQRRLPGALREADQLVKGPAQLAGTQFIGDGLDPVQLRSGHRAQVFALEHGDARQPVHLSLLHEALVLRGQALGKGRGAAFQDF